MISEKNYYRADVAEQKKAWQEGKTLEAVIEEQPDRFSQTSGRMKNWKIF